MRLHTRVEKLEECQAQARRTRRIRVVYADDLEADHRDDEAQEDDIVILVRYEDPPRSAGETG